MSAVSSPHPVELLSALVDGELSTEERHLVESHLMSCPSCSALLREMEMISRAASAEEAPPLPEHLEAGVKSRLFPVAARPAARRITAGWGFRLPIAAAALFAGALALWVAARGFRGASPVEDSLSPRTEVSAPRARRADHDASVPEQAEALKEGEPAPGEGDLSASRITKKEDPGARDEQASGGPQPSVKMLEEPPSAPGGESAPDAKPGQEFAPTPPPGAFRRDDEKKAADSASDSRAKVRQGVSSLAARSAAPPEAAEEPARPGALAKDAATPAAPSSLVAMTPAENDRRLTLREADGLTITLLESGHLRVEGPDYRCSVSLMAPSRPAEMPGVVAQLFISADRALEAAGQAAPSMKPRVAQPPPGGTAGVTGGQAAKGSIPGGAAPPGEGLSLTGSNGTTQLLAAPGMGAPEPEELASLRDTLRRLALETHRREIEDACGPLPGIPGP